MLNTANLSENLLILENLAQKNEMISGNRSRETKKNLFKS